MGAEWVFTTLPSGTKESVEKAVDKLINDAPRYYSEEDDYAGGWTNVPGLQFLPDVCASETEAHKLAEQKAQKWGSAVAVEYKSQVIDQKKIVEFIAEHKKLKAEIEAINKPLELNTVSVEIVGESADVINSNGRKRRAVVLDPDTNGPESYYKCVECGILYPKKTYKRPTCSNCHEPFLSAEKLKERTALQERLKELTRKGIQLGAKETWQGFTYPTQTVIPGGYFVGALVAI